MSDCDDLYARDAGRVDVGPVPVGRGPARPHFPIRRGKVSAIRIRTTALVQGDARKNVASDRKPFWLAHVNYRSADLRGLYDFIGPVWQERQLRLQSAQARRAEP